MSDRRRRGVHRGERLVHAKRQTPDELARQMPGFISLEMPQQHAEFFSELPYLPIATLDGHGRPWATLLVTRSNDDRRVGITVPQTNRLSVMARTTALDPFVEAAIAGWELDTVPRLFAGVGVDFRNRRRNKLAGSIRSATLGADGLLALDLETNEHLGNCPKYITVRSLEPFGRQPTIEIDSRSEFTGPLPDECRRHIDRVSTVFLAAKYQPGGDALDATEPYLGLNHRGGNPGFVRVLEPDARDGTSGASLALPDFSGNRLYQSLGNIEVSPHVGVLFPDFETGHLLFVTGRAENLYDEQAEALMPRVTLLTRIQVNGLVLIKDALDLRLVSAEQFSPYNPPLRLLKNELAETGHGQIPGTGGALQAKLVSTRALASNLKTFTFELPTPVSVPWPGGFGVFDFSAELGSGYSHMNEANPQAVNDDLLRTCTLSAASSYDASRQAFSETRQLQVTVKRQRDGLVSSFLHALKNSALSISYRGSGGAFTCFRRTDDHDHPTIPDSMLWVAGGAGITPFMAMWDGICQVSKVTSLPGDIMLLFAAREDEILILREMLRSRARDPGGCPKLRIRVFQTGDTESSRAARETLKRDLADFDVSVETKRIGRADFERVSELSDRAIYLCGPAALMVHARTHLNALAGDVLEIHEESYLF